jgi:acyl-CoA thioester hydrolase
MTDMPARPHHISIRVYYEDTDFSGAVYHANYLHFFERARTELLRDLGVDQVALFEKEGLGFVVRSLAIDYLKPARMDDCLRVETVLDRLGRASIELSQSIWRAHEQLATGKLRLGLVGMGRPRPIPADIYGKLESILTVSNEVAKHGVERGDEPVSDV